MGFNIGNLLGSAANAFGGPWGAVAGGVLGGLFGGSGKPELSPEQQQQYRLQHQISQQLMGYANSVPGSAPDEQAALANSRGQLGAEQAIQRNNVFAAYNPMTDRGNAGDMMQHLASQQVAQNMNVTNQQMLQAMAQRRQALLNASGVGATAANIAGSGRVTPGPDFASLFGNLGQQIAYNNELNRRQPTAPVTNGNAGTTLTMPGVMGGVGTGGPNGSAGSLNPAPLMGGFRGSFAPGTNDHDKAMFGLGNKMSLGGFR